LGHCAEPSIEPAHYAAVLELAAEADPVRPEVVEARAYVAAR
jgi:hypothetical protein